MAEEQDREPDLGEALDALMGGLQAEIHTCLPGIVQKYSGGKADVLPAFRRAYRDEDGGEVVVSYPVVTNVPVMTPRGGGAYVSIPLKKGDPVVLICSQRSMDRYLETDGSAPVDPADARMHHITDAWCYPGGGTFRNAAPAHADDLVIGLEDGACEIHVAPGGEVKIKASAVRLGDLAASEALAIAATTDARLSALESFASAHTHTGNLGGPTSPAIVPLVPGAGGASTAASKVYGA